MYYLDNGATTPLLPEVKNYIISLMDNYYNPSSQYKEGVLARNIVNEARVNVAKFINTDANNIIFTSGGSASNTLAIKGFINRNNYSVLYSPIAHKSILKCVKSIKKAYPLSVGSTGSIKLSDLNEYLNGASERFLVVLDYANSEIGTIQDVKKIIDLVHFYNGKVYLDCTGSIGQIPVDVKELNVDMIGFSGHKIGALKGIGVLYKKSNIELEPLIYGNQEQGLFSGTENTIGISSIGKAVECLNYSSISSRNRDYVYKYLVNNIPDCYLIGACLDYRLPYNLYMCFQGCEGEALLTLLDMEDIKVSTGSACNSGELNSSTTLKAIHLDKDDINCCVRLTFSGKETQNDLDFICSKIKECVEKIRNYSGYISSLNIPLSPYIELDGGYAVCNNCHSELEPWQEKCKCGQVQDWSWRHNKEDKR